MHSCNLHVFGDIKYGINDINKDIKRIKTINCGDSHTIISDIDNNYWINGRNDYGQCGDLIHLDEIRGWQKMQWFHKQYNYIQIRNIYTSVGQNHNVFWVTTNGLIYGNGLNYHNQLGINSRLSSIVEPVIIRDLTMYNVIDIKGGFRHNIALCQVSIIQTIECIIHIISYWMMKNTLNINIPHDIYNIIWRYYFIKSVVLSAGHDWYYEHENFGQAGHGKYSFSIHANEWNEIEALKDKSIISIGCGKYHSIFLDSRGVVYACGDNVAAQLGLGHNNIDKYLPPTPIPYFISSKIIIKKISTGSGHNLCIDNNQNVYSWGWNNLGQCGHHINKDKYINTPQIIDHLANYDIIDIKCGYNHSYVYSKENLHFLFGVNRNGECSLKKRDSDKIYINVPLIINDIFQDITGQIIGDVYLGFDITLIVADINKLREIHTNPILPDDIDENGNLPYLRCGWKRCGRKFNNKNQLFKHVKYALYGDSRPLLHGFHLHSQQILLLNPNITLSEFKIKVRNSFKYTKYNQYIKLKIYDKKMEYYFNQFKKIQSSY